MKTGTHSLLKFFLIIVSAQVASAAWAEDEVLTLTDLSNAYVKKNVTHVSVHDPSIFLDTISSKTMTYYYMLGSHMDMARMMSSGGTLLNPSKFNNGGEYGTSFFKNVKGTSVTPSNAYATHAVTRVLNYEGVEVDFPNFNAHDWQYKGFSVVGNQWAPDVVYNPTMKKWLMYMSLNGDNWCSSIVCFTADKATGPYIYQGPVVCSGFSGKFEHNGYASADDWKRMDLSIATGYTSLPARYNPSGTYGTYWPNCIDPCVFYDEEGRLWMSYGSWSGGIWMLELDENTGLRDYTVRYPYQVNGSTVTPGSANANCTSDPYFGKRISGGWYDSGEGSSIEHIGDYYYLFVSYGFFEPTGGYEMRVYRSQKPDGPYVDAKGGSALEKDSYKMNYGSNARFYNGVKLMGNYQWGFMTKAEIAQGHNSAVTDPQGRTLLCYHTKFNDGTLAHEMRLHQLFQNQEGWLVAAPYEFHNETITQQDIATQENIPNAEIPGNYQLLRHVFRVDYASMAYQKPTNIVLKASDSDPYRGTITGFSSSADTWRRVPGTDYIELKLSGINYRGVLCRQTIDGSNISSLCFSAITKAGEGSLGSSAQLSIWGSKAEYKAAIKCTLDELKVPVTEGMELTADINLPTNSRLGAVVTWSSSDPMILTDRGAVVGDGLVDLTLTIAKDGYRYDKNYSLKVGDYTAIESTVVDNVNSTIWYDICGKKVQQPGRGLYVKNGKKVLVY